MSAETIELLNRFLNVSIFAVVLAMVLCVALAIWMTRRRHKTYQDYLDTKSNRQRYLYSGLAYPATDTMAQEMSAFLPMCRRTNLNLLRDSLHYWNKSAPLPKNEACDQKMGRGVAKVQHGSPHKDRAKPSFQR